MLKSRKISAVLLALVLLLNQLALFGAEQGYARGAMEKNTLIAEQQDFSQQDPRVPAHTGGRCSHGCHFQSHFVGYVAQTGSVRFIVAASEAPALFRGARILSRTVEAPYRPPRFYRSA